MHESYISRNGKLTIHRRQGAYWRGRQVGAACGRSVSDTRQAIASRPQLTAGEVLQGDIKKPQSLGLAFAAVNAHRQSRLDTPLAANTLSRQEDPVKIVPSPGVVTTIDTHRPSPYTGAIDSLSVQDTHRRYDRDEPSV
jgi:hypothetical protein